MSQVHRLINLTVVVAVEIEPGLEVPAGTYTGKKTTLRGQGRNWTEPRYILELTAAQLNALAAAQPTANLLSVEYDVTKFVKLGQIVVS